MTHISTIFNNYRFVNLKRTTNSLFPTLQEKNESICIKRKTGLNV